MLASPQLENLSIRKKALSSLQTAAAQTPPPPHDPELALRLLPPRVTWCHRSPELSRVGV